MARCRQKLRNKNGLKTNPANNQQEKGASAVPARQA